jgi:hypothetical protein
MSLNAIHSIMSYLLFVIFETIFSHGIRLRKLLILFLKRMHSF